MTEDLYVLLGFYQDKSGVKLFGIYEVMSTAKDRLDILNSAGTSYYCKIIKMKLNQACPQDVF